MGNSSPWWEVLRINGSKIVAQYAMMHAQEKLMQQGVNENGLERREAMDRILGGDGGNTTRCAHPKVVLANA